MSDDPYIPPETDVRVHETLPPRPILGVALAFLFSFISGLALMTLFSFVVVNLLNTDAATAGENADPISRLRLVTNLYYGQMFAGLIIAFAAGFMCIRISRSKRWRYLVILIGLSAIPTLLMMLANDELRSPLILGSVVLQSATILIGGKIAMIRLRTQKNHLPESCG